MFRSTPFSFLATQSLQTSQDFTLAKGNVMTLPASTVASIEAINGGAWVTITGGEQDFFVQSRAVQPIPAHAGSVVFEALTERTLLRVTRKERASTQSTARAAIASVLHPIGHSLRVIANWVDPVAQNSNGTRPI